MLQRFFFNVKTTTSRNKKKRVQRGNIQLLSKLCYLFKVIHIILFQRHVNLHLQPRLLSEDNALDSSLPTICRISESIM
ncbi:hypothetical protein D3C73_1223830 [compost metagenome]